MITLEYICKINKKMIERYDGAGIGIRNKNLAISIIDGINQEVFGRVMYPTVEEKISHIVVGIIQGHIFIDANKRTGLATLLILCDKYNIDVNYDKENLAIEIALNKINESDLSNMLKKWNKK
ncbi:TPA: type II toxin-antitoxin system death-on-curing family toxin [Clostridioides difficile]|nr:type II toxin-antitoxin system death-on-curing family toxin [Clostridioides difficile]